MALLSVVTLRGLVFASTWSKMFKSFVNNKVTNQDKRNYGPDYEVIFWYKETLCNNLSIQFMMHHIFF